MGRDREGRQNLYEVRPRLIHSAAALRSGQGMLGCRTWLSQCRACAAKACPVLRLTNDLFVSLHLFVIDRIRSIKVERTVLIRSAPPPSVPYLMLVVRLQGSRVGGSEILETDDCDRPSGRPRTGQRYRQITGLCEIALSLPCLVLFHFVETKHIVQCFSFSPASSNSGTDRCR